MRLLGTFIAASAMCASAMCASLVFHASESQVEPGGRVSVGITVVGRPGEQIAAVSLLMQDPRRTGWFWIAGNLDRSGSPLAEPVSMPDLHPWPQMLGGPDGTNGYNDGGFWRGVDLGGMPYGAPWCWVDGEIPLGRAELLVSRQALPGTYQIGADSTLTGWTSSDIAWNQFDSVTGLSFVIVPEPEETAIVLAAICSVLVVVRLLILRTR